jgi:protein required for attachment to host cells
MKSTWIVVAESANARIFSMDKRGAPWQEITDLIHVESRLTQTELESDRPGRSNESHSAGSHAMEPRQNRKITEALVFARQIAEFLTLHEQEFEHLILVCAPKFLGQLREKLGKSLNLKVSSEIDRNVVHYKVDKIRALVSGI